MDIKTGEHDNGSSCRSCREKRRRRKGKEGGEKMVQNNERHTREERAPTPWDQRANKTLSWDDSIAALPHLDASYLPWKERVAARLDRCASVPA